MIVDFFSAMWNRPPADMPLWQIFLFCTWFYSLFIFLFICMGWLVSEFTAERIGYPKRSGKTMRKRLKRYTFWERALLIRLTVEAERKCFALYLNLICYYIQILSLVACTVGYIGCLITNGVGWATALFFGSVFAGMIVSYTIMLIPQLVYRVKEVK